MTKAEKKCKARGYHNLYTGKVGGRFNLEVEDNFEEISEGRITCSDCKAVATFSWAKFELQSEA